MTQGDPNLVELDDEEWRDVQRAAAELDLIHGGYFRARLQAVEIFCGPENAPAGWNDEFTWNSMDTRRASVGVAELVGPAGPTRLTVRLRVANWGAIRSGLQSTPKSEDAEWTEEWFEQEVAALRGRAEEWEWLRRRFAALRAHAAGTLVLQAAPRGDRGKRRNADG